MHPEKHKMKGWVPSGGHLWGGGPRVAPQATNQMTHTKYRSQHRFLRGMKRCPCMFRGRGKPRCTSAKFKAIWAGFILIYSKNLWFIYIFSVICTVFRNHYILLKQISTNFNYIVPSYMVIAIIFVRGSFASVSLLDWNYSTMIILWIILEINSYALTTKSKKNLNITAISRNTTRWITF